MNKFLQSFKDKRFKYGSYSTLIALFVVAILIVVNLVVGKFDIKFDLTPSEAFSISDTSKEVISNIDSDITIYALFKTGSEDKDVTEILEQYQSVSKNINIVYKDPYIYPQFVNEFKTDGEDIPNNSLIVVSGSKFKVINYSELFTGYSDYSGQAYKASSNVEAVVTSAIKYVTMESVPVIYYVTGHGETEIPELLKSQLTSANYDIKEFDLLMNSAVPEDCSVLLMTNPVKDYSEKETEAVKNYLASDGRAIVLTQFSTDNVYKNFNSIINAYGVQQEEGLIYEASPENLLQNVPTFVLPDFSEHDITNRLIEKKYRVFLPYVQAVSEMELKKSSITVEPLLTTSNQSYIKKNMQSETFYKEQGDTDGPFNAAVAVTDSYYTDTQHTTKLVVVGSSSFILDEINQIIGGNNSTFIVNALSWLNDSEDSIFISPKSLISQPLVIDSASIRWIVLVSCVLQPVVIFGIGFIIWLRRRNR